MLLKKVGLIALVSSLATIVPIHASTRFIECQKGLGGPFNPVTGSITGILSVDDFEEAGVRRVLSANLNIVVRDTGVPGGDLLRTTLTGPLLESSYINEDTSFFLEGGSFQEEMTLRNPSHSGFGVSVAKAGMQYSLNAMCKVTSSTGQGCAQKAGFICYKDFVTEQCRCMKDPRK